MICLILTRQCPALPDLSWNAVTAASLIFSTYPHIDADQLLSSSFPIGNLCLQRQIHVIIAWKGGLP